MFSIDSGLLVTLQITETRAKSLKFTPESTFKGNLHKANYPRENTKHVVGKTNFQQTRLKISWLTVNVYLASQIKQARSEQKKPNRRK